jgi:hypothetical protein
MRSSSGVGAGARPTGPDPRTRGQLMPAAAHFAANAPVQSCSLVT